VLANPEHVYCRGLRFRWYRLLLNQLLNHLSFRRGGVLGMAQAMNNSMIAIRL
jgi:hypothetical protein